MPNLNICIECDKSASLLLDNVPYCTKHYKEEKEREKKSDRLR